MDDIFISFPNGKMMIKCDRFFPCTIRYIRMLDKVISLSDDSQELRQWLIRYLEQRVNIESNDKVKTKLKKNYEFMRVRYAETQKTMYPVIRK